LVLGAGYLVVVHIENKLSGK